MYGHFTDAQVDKIVADLPQTTELYEMDRTARRSHSRMRMQNSARRLLKLLKFNAPDNIIVREALMLSSRSADFAFQMTD